MENVDTGHQATATIPVSVANEIVVIAVSAEGRDVKLLGRRGVDRSWMFCRVTSDCSWGMLDAKMKTDQTVPIPRWVSSWSDAMALLDRYPWATLRPTSVLGEFQAAVLAEVTGRLVDAPAARREEQMAHWQRVCAGAAP